MILPGLFRKDKSFRNEITQKERRTTRAIIKEKREKGIVVKEVDGLTPKPNEVLARVKAASICGTDLHIFEWDKTAAAMATPPMILGHEFAAEVIEVGSSVTTLKKGDKISAESHIYCGTCFQCRIGNFHLCERMKVRGVNTDGCFAEYVVVSENTAWKNDESLPEAAASAQEPFGSAVHAVFSGEVTGRSVVVFGCGPIGLSAIKLCKYAGAESVIAVDISDYRLDLATKMQADLVINATTADTRARIRERLPHGADVILEMSGSEKALNDGLKVVRPGGRVALVGLPSDGVSIDLSNDVIWKYLTIQGVFGRKIFETWELSHRLLRNGAVDLESIVTHNIKMDKIGEAFELMKHGACGKIVLRW